MLGNFELVHRARRCTEGLSQPLSIIAEPVNVRIIEFPSYNPRENLPELEKDLSERRLQYCFETANKLIENYTSGEISSEDKDSLESTIKALKQYQTKYAAMLVAQTSRWKSAQTSLEHARDTLDRSSIPLDQQAMKFFLRK